MRFKQWWSESVGTAVLHGGIGEAPNDGVNIGFPVRSKTSCVDGSPPEQEEKTEKSPERVFGFLSKKDKDRTKERETQVLNRKGRFFTVDVKPSSIGFTQG